MTKKENGVQKSREQTDQADYEVGYGRPPAKTRFKPGQSGNPRGRPKGSRNATTIVHEFLNHRVRFQSPSGVQNGTVLEAIIWKQIEQATKGDGRAVRTLLEIDERFRPSDADDPDQSLSAGDEVLLQAFVDRSLKQRREQRKK